MSIRSSGVGIGAFRFFAGLAPTARVVAFCTETLLAGRRRLGRYRGRRVRLGLTWAEPSPGHRQDTDNTHLALPFPKERRHGENGLSAETRGHVRHG